MLKAFKEDAARWVIPGQIAPQSQLTTGKILSLLYNHMSLRAMLIWRFAAWCRQKRIPLMYGFLHRSMLVFFGLEICSAEKIGGGLYIAHPAGTVIQVESMGKKGSIIASVTVGMRNSWEFPVIGENVYIGAGARVLGNITIGNDVIIGANAVVIEDVPAGATVVGIPGRVIKVNGEPVFENPENLSASIRL